MKPKQQDVAIILLFHLPWQQQQLFTKCFASNYPSLTLLVPFLTKHTNYHSINLPISLSFADFCGLFKLLGFMFTPMVQFQDS
ncbi:hypothetical protein L6452_41766 [Arctium lappa]|uniref:Uncharacterized protein n=1 Tax=Arctium lappa TaxID=4217 RepID=A0ACB8XQ29_ARCLA|nr:hypothetical protein L6452_41766 [Arctium lappa]